MNDTEVQRLIKKHDIMYKSLEKMAGLDNSANSIIAFYTLAAVSLCGETAPLILTKRETP